MFMIYNKTVDFNSPDKLNPNPSFALPYSFRLAIDGQKYKNALFSVQRVSIPDISAEAAPMNLPQRNIGFAPDKITYTNLDLSFLIDEDFMNYVEIHDWMYGAVTAPDDTNVKKYRDISLIILNSHNNPVREFKFVNAFPTSLSSIQLDATSTEAEYLVANVMFHYSYFKIT
jgi:hypothetical protein